MDLEMFLPGTRVKMSLVDRIKIIMPTVSGSLFPSIRRSKGRCSRLAAGMYGILAVLGVTAATESLVLRLSADEAEISAQPDRESVLSESR